MQFLEIQLGLTYNLYFCFDRFNQMQKVQAAVILSSIKSETNKQHNVHAIVKEEKVYDR